MIAKGNAAKMKLLAAGKDTITDSRGVPVNLEESNAKDYIWAADLSTTALEEICDYHDLILTAWLRKQGILSKDDTLTVHPDDLAKRGQWLYREGHNINNFPLGFEFDGEIVIYFIY